MILPICYCAIEYLVCDVFYHLCYQLFLYGCELLGGIVFGVCRKLSFEVFGVVLVVDKAHVHRHLKLHLAAVAAAGYAFVVLVEAGDFSGQLKVAVLLYLAEFGLTGKDVGESVLEDALHGGPYVGAADGEVVDLYGLGLLIVYAGTIELVADGAGGEEYAACEACKKTVCDVFILQCHSL